MHSGAIIRVFCVDGPCEGLRYLNPDTGRVLFSDVAEAERAVYKVRDEEHQEPFSARIQPRTSIDSIHPSPDAAELHANGAVSGGRADLWRVCVRIRRTVAAGVGC